MSSTTQREPAEDLVSILSLAREHVPDAGVGIAVRGVTGTPLTLAASDPVVEEADRLQERHADGPVVSAAWPASQVAVADLRVHRLWPVWAPAVVDLGICRVLSTRIATPQGHAGALTLYYTAPADFGAHELALAGVLAGCIAGELAHAHDVANLTTAVEARTGIGQAQGILMERFGVSAPDAFSVLRRHSQDTNTKLGKVAASLVSTRGLDSYATRRHPADEHTP